MLVFAVLHQLNILEYIKILACELYLSLVFYNTHKKKRNWYMKFYINFTKGLQQSIKEKRKLVIE